MPTKAERLAEVFRRLRAAPRVETAMAAFELVCSILNAVEDELSGLPYDANLARVRGPSGRMYPPLADSEIPSMIPGTRCFAARHHFLHVAPNGAILIRNSKTLAAKRYSMITPMHELERMLRGEFPQLDVEYTPPIAEAGAHYLYARGDQFISVLWTSALGFSIADPANDDVGFDAGHCFDAVATPAEAFTLIKSLLTRTQPAASAR